MKKTVALCMAAILAWMPLSGCGGETVPPASGEAASSAGEEQSGAPGDEAAPTAEAEEPPEDAAAAAPICGEQLEDGVYELAVSSSSSMFRIVDAQLTVAGGEMTAVLTLSGTGYGKLYMGTAEEALAGPEDNGIPYVENAQGQFTYAVPVAALNQDTDVAAWSIRKEKWYDRVLVFRLPETPREAAHTRATAEPPADGRYTVEVTLTGGSGKAGVQSPTAVTITDGAAVAVVTWSSPHYEHMRIGDDYFYPVATEGGAVFELPVPLDTELAVSAQTTAMSTPHEIDYTLFFDSGTLKPA